MRAMVFGSKQFGFGLHKRLQLNRSGARPKSVAMDCTTSSVLALFGDKA
jgi:hypothetical protein